MVSSNDAAPVWFITGCSTGLGRALAKRVLQRGYRCVVTARNVAQVQTIVAPYPKHGLALALDVTNQAQLEQAVAQAEASFGGIDVLVNNAGYGDIAPMETTTDKDLRAVFDTNVFGLMAVTRAFLPRMRERGKGRIVNVSSLGGLFTLPLFGAYNSTKHAVESISDALRIELRPFGIEVSLIEPGPIKTKFSTSSLKSVERYQDGSPYAPVLARFADLTRRTDKMAPGPRATSRAIHHAAASRWPRARYKLTLSSRLMVAFLRAIPTRLSDAILRRVLRLTPKHLAPKLSPKAKSELTTSRAA